MDTPEDIESLLTEIAAEAGGTVYRDYSGRFMFGDTCVDTTGDRSAILYTVIESCRRRGLDPYAYLKDVLTRLPALINRQVREITPANRARTRPAPRSLAA